ncbi:hypothetical protein [Pseudobacteriovorax antillogorgiicola]|uniref:Uncharacterized protein n=1 Tax=Pseudobacteriovorax antillogorgiicola TaxID=1513793 RepID=A0A1Y6CJY3_9BACT|nr:hypothetical protein [Pseudobacteriovorax antillogorgiicola]TCS47643.1 hypothetical protein EDD56_12084 [Pseudobacteriovorax antillogorgiicola]SMF59881.1 hypothetical protein SAMN06296036_12056 [Pseudobacteriovorax antillogorgiicola]
MAQVLGPYAKKFLRNVKAHSFHYGIVLLCFLLLFFMTAFRLPILLESQQTAQRIKQMDQLFPLMDSFQREIILATKDPLSAEEKSKLEWERSNLQTLSQQIVLEDEQALALFQMFTEKLIQGRKLLDQNNNRDQFHDFFKGAQEDLQNLSHHIITLIPHREARVRFQGIQLIEELRSMVGDQQGSTDDLDNFIKFKTKLNLLAQLLSPGEQQGLENLRQAHHWLILDSNQGLATFSNAPSQWAWAIREDFKSLRQHLITNLVRQITTQEVKQSGRILIEFGGMICCLTMIGIMVLWRSRHHERTYQENNDLKILIADQKKDTDRMSRNNLAIRHELLDTQQKLEDSQRELQNHQNEIAQKNESITKLRLSLEESQEEAKRSQAIPKDWQQARDAQNLTIANQEQELQQLKEQALENQENLQNYKNKLSKVYNLLVPDQGRQTMDDWDQFDPSEWLQLKTSRAESLEKHLMQHKESLAATEQKREQAETRCQELMRQLKNTDDELKRLKHYRIMAEDTIKSRELAIEEQETRYRQSYDELEKTKVQLQSEIQRRQDLEQQVDRFYFDLGQHYPHLLKDTPEPNLHEALASILANRNS